MEEQHQAVGHSLAGPHDEHIEVNSDGHRPEEGAGVGEGGHGALSHAGRRVAVESPPDPEGVGGGGQPVRHRQEDQQPAGGRPQVRPQDEGEDDQRGAHKGQRAGTQHDHLLREVHNCPVPICGH